MNKNKKINNKTVKTKTNQSKTLSKIPVPALNNGLNILELVLASEQKIGFNEIVNHVGLPRASTARLLKVLKDRGYVAKDGTSGKYKAGSNTIGLKNRRPLIDVLRKKSRSVLESLVEKTNNTALVVYWAGQQMQCLNKVIHQQSIPMQDIGNINTDFSMCPWGWIFYQHLSAPKQKKTLEYMKDKKYFLKRLPELEAYYQKHGFYYDDQEFIKPLRRLTAPVYSNNGDLIGAIGLGGNPLTILNGKVKQMGRMVAEHAQMLSEQL